MTDILSAQERSANMARIHGSNTQPELMVRRSLHAAGYRFRLHASHLPGRPDIILPSRRTVILVHGCFWHRHPGGNFAYRPKSRLHFWENKFSATTARDQFQISTLISLGWKVIVVWECTLRGKLRRSATLKVLCNSLASSSATYQEFPVQLIAESETGR